MNDKRLRVGLAIGVVGMAVLLWFVPDFAVQQALAFAVLALWPLASWSRLFPGGWAARLLTAGGLALLLQTLLALLLHYLPGAPPRGLLVTGLALVGLLPLLWPGHGWPKLPRLQKREGWLLVGLILLTLLLRWPNLGYKEFQGDEGVIMTRAAAMLTGDDAELFLHQKGPVEILLPFLQWGSGAATMEFWVRLPFWWASVLLVGAMVWLGRRWFSREIGLLVGLIFVLNGFGVAFSRIVQYQTLVMLWGALAVIFADLYREQGRRWQLWCTAVFLAGGLLAHYDAVLVVPVILWLLWPRFWPLARLDWRGWGAGLLLGGGILALFYLPFVLNPNFGRTGSYLFSDRLGGSLLSWSGPEVWQMATFYNSLYYVAGLIILISLGLGWRNGRRAIQTAAWLYFLVPLAFYLFIVADPRTHVYTFFPGAAVLAALGVVRLTARRGAWLVLAMLGVVTAVYPFLLFIDTRVERQRNWAELRPTGYPTTFAEPPLFGLFGFPYQAGWRAVADLPLTPPIASNEEQEITDVYLGQAARTFCPDTNTFILAQNVQDSVPYDPAMLADWHLQYEVVVNGRQTMQIFSREPVAEVVQVEAGESAGWLVETAVAPPTYQPQNPLNIILGNQEIRLLGYDIDLTHVQPGGKIPLTLYWESLLPVSQNYQVFTHLVRDEIIGQDDAAPECGVNPTARWEPGQIIRDTHIIPIKEEVAPGSSVLKIGMYDLATAVRLPIQGAPDNILTLLEVEIRP
ncbi:MAG: glycosyltransferase family 39 protein [Anaerolineales bacterium]|nr:glycosyltransferase family 39 protein [Anaerolineales bacterium]MCB8940216.1 glycosyltransferase family 39 protein [Ardenticatenaceae bacterium]